MNRLLVLVLISVLAACASPSATAPLAETSEPTASAIPTEEPTATPRRTARPLPTPEPTDPPTAINLPGEELTVTNTSTDDIVLRVVVDQVGTVPSYADTTSGVNCCPDEPQIPGNVFIEVFVTYEAVEGGTSFGSFDWQVYSGNQQVTEQTAFALNGPKPDLQFGELPAGRTASGWLVFEVPPTGPLTLAYLPAFANNTEPIGEYLLRE